MKLVVNRKKTPKPHPVPKRKTVKNVLAFSAAHAADIEAVLVVSFHRDGKTKMSWSNQRNCELLWLAEYAAHALKTEMMGEPL